MTVQGYNMFIIHAWGIVQVLPIKTTPCIAVNLHDAAIHGHNVPWKLCLTLVCTGIFSEKSDGNC